MRQLLRGIAETLLRRWKKGTRQLVVDDARQLVVDDVCRSRRQTISEGLNSVVGDNAMFKTRF